MPPVATARRDRAVSPKTPRRFGTNRAPTDRPASWRAPQSVGPIERGRGRGVADLAGARPPRVVTRSTETLHAKPRSAPPVPPDGAVGEVSPPFCSRVMSGGPIARPGPPRHGLPCWTCHDTAERKKGGKPIRAVHSTESVTSETDAPRGRSGRLLARCGEAVVRQVPRAGRGRRGADRGHRSSSWGPPATRPRANRTRR